MKNIFNIDLDLKELDSLDDIPKNILLDLKNNQYSVYNDDSLGRLISRSAPKLRQKKILAISNDKRLDLNTIAFNKNAKFNQEDLKIGIDELVSNLLDWNKKRGRKKIL